MITVFMTDIIGYLLIVPLSIIMFLWLYDNQKRDERHVVPTRKTLVECDLCLLRFTADKADKYVRCPRCGNLMERQFYRSRKRS